MLICDSADERHALWLLQQELEKKHLKCELNELLSNYLLEVQLGTGGQEGLFVSICRVPNSPESEYVLELEGWDRTGGLAYERYAASSPHLELMAVIVPTYISYLDEINLRGGGREAH